MLPYRDIGSSLSDSGRLTRKKTLISKNNLRKRVLLAIVRNFQLRLAKISLYFCFYNLNCEICKVGVAKSINGERKKRKDETEEKKEIRKRQKYVKDRNKKMEKIFSK